jgi:antitoxin component YwqK of YwqJK toxin-antitoxin module
MKNILFPILIILCSCNGFKDETVKRYKESEIKEESKNFWVSIETGEALTGIVYRKEGNSNGDTTTYERNFKNGKILSLKSFNKDGSLLGETFYENGLISKSWSEIGVYRDEQTFKKGKLILEKRYSNGKLESTFNGTTRLFFNPDGSKKNGTFKDTLCGGWEQTCIEKYENGKLIFDTAYPNNR